MKTEQTQTHTLIRKNKWVKNMLAVSACHLYPLPYNAVLLSMIFTDDPCIQILLYEGKSESKVPYFIVTMHGVLLLRFTPPNETVNSAAYQATLKKN
jgi:hypothetical protein